MKRATSLQTIMAIAVLLFTGGAAAAEEATINAYATWEGRGQIYPTGVDQATFVGAFSGVMFVEDAEDLLATGNIICPGVMELDLSDGSQVGHGQCTISNAAGERVFAEWTCTGKVLTGCDGLFKLTAGTGSLEGITGEGDFTVRTGLQAIAGTMAGNVVQRTAAGLAIWRNFRYSIPD